MSANAEVTRLAPGVGTFRTIVWKELRQGLTWGTVAAVIVVVALLYNAEQLANSWESIGLFTSSGSVPSIFTLASAAAALVIGCGQLYRESRGDMWAFLVHRPVRRSTLFWGKVTAGAISYVIAVAVPLACWLGWEAMPGHLHAPFDVRMTLPAVADLLCGFIYYFAALLIVMRRARWYGSRLASVVTAIFFSLLVLHSDPFLFVVVEALVGILVTAAAARSAFLRAGFYEPASRAGRVALALPIGIGLFFVGLCVAVLLVPLLELSNPTDTSSPEHRYQSTHVAVSGQDGTLVRGLWQWDPFTGKSPLIAVRDLNGQPLARFADSASRSARLDTGVVSTELIPLNVDGDYPEFSSHTYRGTEDIVVPLVNTPRQGVASWYFMPRLALIAVYDNYFAHRRIGWMRPDGLSLGDSLPSHRFTGDLRPYVGGDGFGGIHTQSLIAFPQAVYRLDIVNRRIRKVFTAPPGEEVTGASDAWDHQTVVTTSEVPRQFDVIATTKRIYLQARDGTPELSVPLDPRAAGYGGVTVQRAMLAPGTPTFVWYKPKYGTLTPDQLDSAKDQITKVALDGTIAGHVNVWPDDEPSRVAPRTQWAQIVGVGSIEPLTIPVLTVLLDSADRRSAGVPGFVRVRHEPPRIIVVGWVATAAGALIAVCLVLAIGRKYAFGGRRLAVWITLSVLLGLLGVLLMLSLVDWPAREPCPSCGQKRIVTRARCEHCGSAFDPPPMDGTEIFEEVAVA